MHASEARCGRIPPLTGVLVYLLLALAPLPAMAAVGTAPGGNGAAPAAISSERLRAIMEDIRRNVESDVDAGASPETIDRAHIAPLVEAIEELLYHAELMSADSAPRGIDQNDVVTFRALASQLYTEALNVRSLTEGITPGQYEMNLLGAAVERLYQTCAACHDLFRDMDAGMSAPAP
jgi:hypothetical protein